MITNQETIYAQDTANKKMIVTREFDAPVAQVWKAWTESELLDQWWAPRPWKAKTKTMDFRNGGSWIYSMVGPDDSEQKCRADFSNIVKEKSFSVTDYFCDANGNRDNNMPIMHWKNEFSDVDGTTSVKVEITFESEKDMEKIIEMGFKEGFAAALTNLDEFLAK